MAAGRVTVPATSVAAAGVLGMGTAAVTIALSQPGAERGLPAAAGVLAGSLLFSTGLAATHERGPIGLAAGGTVLHAGLVVLLAAGVRAGIAAPITAIASGFAVAGAVLLSLVVVGYSDPASLRPQHGLLVQWSLLLFAIGAGTVLLTAAGESVVGLESPVPGYVRGVSASSAAATWAVAVHLGATALSARVALGQLEALDLLASPRSDAILRKVLISLSAAGTLLLAPAVVANVSRILRTIAGYSPGAASLAVSAGSIVRVPALHLLFFLFEGVAASVICLGFLLRVVRRVSYERAALFAGYLVCPLVVAASLAAGSVFVADVVGVDPFGRVLAVLPVGGWGTPTAPGYLVGFAALAGFVLYTGVTVGLTALRVVLGSVCRFGSRGLPAAASASLFTGTAFLGFTGTWPPVVACCLVGAILTWDVLENGIGLGEQLKGRFDAVPNEVAHLFASGLVGGVAVVVGLVTYGASRSISSGGAPPVLVVGLLLSAGVVFALLLRRI